jgi:hypothetical protein
MLRHRHLKTDIGILELRPPFGCIDHLRGRIDAHNTRAALREFDGERPVAAAHVHDPAAADIAD